MQLSAAPRPRPPPGLPQPINPTRMTSLPAAWTLPASSISAAKAAAPITLAAEVFKNSRRFDDLLAFVLNSEAMIDSPWREESFSLGRRGRRPVAGFSYLIRFLRIW